MGQHLFDTQLISYAMQGNYILPTSDVAISSTTAQELLLVQGKKLTHNNYYVPNMGTHYPMARYDFNRAMRSMPQKYRNKVGKGQTDQLILDFGRDYPTVVEYSHQAIAAALNRRNFDLLENMARALGPTRHRVVVRRLNFLLIQSIHCVALSRQSAEVGLELFRSFVDDFTLKRNFRNSLNDILTLAVAQASCSVLHTDDELLSSFANRYSKVPVNRNKIEIAIDFTRPPTPRRVSRGTKGYVNFGWRVRG